jgi:hypothetical protein
VYTISNPTTFHTALSKFIYAIPPHHPPSKMVHLQEDVEKILPAS